MMYRKLYFAPKPMEKLSRNLNDEVSPYILALPFLFSQCGQSASFLHSSIQEEAQQKQGKGCDEHIVDTKRLLGEQDILRAEEVHGYIQHNSHYTALGGSQPAIRYLEFSRHVRTHID